MELSAALGRRGWQVKQVPASETPDGLLAVTGAEVLVLASEGAGDDAALLAADAYRRAGGTAELVLLLAPGSAAQWRWAAALTPFVHPWPLDAETVATLVAQVAARGAGAPAAPVPRDEVRRVSVRLGESLEVDGFVVDLGVAERNFLFELASRAGNRIAKDQLVEGERGRGIPARECRRRLGRKIGSELAELLVPVLRGEPYRFREPREVLAVSLQDPTGRPPTRLTVLGRGSLRAIGSDCLEMFA